MQYVLYAFAGVYNPLFKRNFKLEIFYFLIMTTKIRRHIINNFMVGSVHLSRHISVN